MEIVTYDTINGVAVSEQEKAYMLDGFQEDLDKFACNPICYLYDDVGILKEVKDINKESVKNQLEQYKRVLKPFNRVFDLDLMRETNLKFDRPPFDEIQKMFTYGLSIKYDIFLLEKILSITTEKDIFEYIKDSYYWYSHTCYLYISSSNILTDTLHREPENLFFLLSFGDNTLEFIQKYKTKGKSF